MRQVEEQGRRELRRAVSGVTSSWKQASDLWVTFDQPLLTQLIRNPLRIQSAEFMATAMAAQCVAASMDPLRESLRQGLRGVTPSPGAGVAANHSHLLSPMEGIVEQYTGQALLGGLGLRLPDVFEQVWSSLRSYLPPNWSDDLSLTDVATIVGEEGVPLAWVPRSEIVDELIQADDRSVRVQALLDRRPEIIADCREVLESLSEPVVRVQVSYSMTAIDLLALNQTAAAQTMAVTATDAAYRAALRRTRWFSSRDYANDQLTRLRAGNWDDLPLQFVSSAAAFAALAPFFAYVADLNSPGLQLPLTLNRHVTAHDPRPEHLTPANAVITVMLMTSVLRGLQDDPDFSVLSLGFDD